MKTLFLACALSVGLAGSAMAAPASQEASIPFVNHHGIRDWQDDGDRAIYVQGANGQWYHGTLMGTCTELPFATTIGFETRGIDTLDRFGTLIVRGQRCALNSLVKSAAPAGKAKAKGKRKVEPAKVVDAKTTT